MGFPLTSNYIDRDQWGLRLCVTCVSVTKIVTGSVKQSAFKFCGELQFDYSDYAFTLRAICRLKIMVHLYVKGGNIIPACNSLNSPNGPQTNTDRKNSIYKDLHVKPPQAVERLFSRNKVGTSWKLRTLRGNYGVIVPLTGRLSCASGNNHVDSVIAQYEYCPTLAKGSK